MSNEQETGSHFDAVDKLLESGKLTDDSDITDIAAAVLGTEEPTEPKGDKGDDKPASGEGDTGGKADAAAADDKSDKSDPEPASDDKKGGNESDPGQQKEEPRGGKTIVGENGETIPYGVLSGTRKQLAEAREKLEAAEAAAKARGDEIAQLKAKLADKSAEQTQQVQQVADDAGITDNLGRPVDVVKVDVSKLRGEYPDVVVDVIEALQNQLATQAQVVNQLRQREASREKSDADSVQDAVQRDIDAVPQLAEWQAATDQTMYSRAVVLDKALMGEAGWKDKPRVERFKEVARLLSGGQSQAAAPTPVKGTKNVDDALARASEKAHPISHSDLPAGSAPAQSEKESLESMDVTDLAAKMNGMTPAQLEEFLSKHG